MSGTGTSAYQRARGLALGTAERAGLDVRKIGSTRHPAGRRARLMRTLGIDLVLDVGANVGEYGADLRRSGYRGRIVSFEPLGAAFQTLSERAERDGAWACVRAALGERQGNVTLHVAGNLASSSILEMLASHAAAAPDSAYVGTEEVPMRTLAAIGVATLGNAARPYLKADVQGYELSVLRGAGDVLPHFAALELELSLVQLYAGGPLMQEVVAFCAERDFILAGVEPGFTDQRSGQLLQLNGIFVRRDLLPVPATSEASKRGA